VKKIILNHKSYLKYEEIITYKEELEKLDIKNIDLILMPNIAYLSLFKNSKITIGSQNFYSYNLGAYTGETSLEILKSLNIKYTLVGHPERLNLKLDTYEKIKDKLYRSLNSGFKTILCVGHDENYKILKKELKYYLKGLDQKSLENLLITYEPSSKIEGEIVNLKEILFAKTLINDYIEKHFNKTIPFLYGGSININNIKEVLEITDGVLIGKYSIDIENIKKIIEKL